MRKTLLGKTVNGKEIEAYTFGDSLQDSILVIGGVHGDEVEGVIAAKSIAKNVKEEKLSQKLIVIQILNLDGYHNRTRKNANGVDLNRNLPTKDWTEVEANVRYSPGRAPNSEPENQALLKSVDQIKPSLIISLHSYKHPMLNVNGNCMGVANKLSGLIGYPAKESVGYPTPGCLGTYYGLERDIPVITYEFLRGMDEQEIISNHVPALLSVFYGNKQ